MIWGAQRVNKKAEWRKKPWRLNWTTPQITWRGDHPSCQKPDSLWNGMWQTESLPAFPRPLPTPLTSSDMTRAGQNYQFVTHSRRNVPHCSTTDVQSFLSLAAFAPPFPCYWMFLFNHNQNVPRTCHTKTLWCGLAHTLPAMTHTCTQNLCFTSIYEHFIQTTNNERNHSLWLLQLHTAAVYRVHPAVNHSSDGFCWLWEILVIFSLMQMAWTKQTEGSVPQKLDGYLWKKQHWIE